MAHPKCAKTAWPLVTKLGVTKTDNIEIEKGGIISRLFCDQLMQ